MWFNAEFAVRVNIPTADIASPLSRCGAIEAYGEAPDDVLGLRLREKETGRKVEMYGKNKEHLARFLASPTLTGACATMPNLTEKDGFRDYVLDSGGAAVNLYDVLLSNDDTTLTCLLGPRPDTAYRDAFRALEAESAADAHARTARAHLGKGQYRESILAAQLAVETACGGRSGDVKVRLAIAPRPVMDAGNALYKIRHVAVHEGDTRIEQPDALRALKRDDASSRLREARTRDRLPSRSDATQRNQITRSTKLFGAHRKITISSVTRLGEHDIDLPIEQACGRICVLHHHHLDVDRPMHRPIEVGN